MIYLDNAATTKPYKDSMEKAAVFNDELYFNPSALYRGGLSCAKEIKSAKDTILKCIGATPSEYEVIFTSCGTEADNYAIFCSVKRGSFVTDKGEHSAVYKSFCELKNKGQTIHFVDLNKDGSVNTDALYEYCKNNVVDFVSIMHVNNETGAINDVNDIAKNLKAINPKIIFHSDGVQAFDKIAYKISPYVDMYSVSAHKINALKGVGALIKRKKVNLAPYIIGGGQENGLRSGTENVFGIKVFQYSAEKHFENLSQNAENVLSLKEYMIKNLSEDFTILSGENSSPYILAVAVKGVRGEIMMHALEEKGIYVGNGSACSSKNRFSRVIEACGYKNDVLDGVVRISFCAENTMDEIVSATKTLNLCACELKRRMN